MAGHKKFTEIRRRAPADDDAEAAVRAGLAEQLERFVGTLADLRRRAGKTQVDLADELAVTQGQVSRIEKSTDPHYSTLARYVDALGGELRLIVRLDGQDLELDLGNPLLPASAREEITITDTGVGAGSKGRAGKVDR